MDILKRKYASVTVFFGFSGFFPFTFPWLAEYEAYLLLVVILSPFVNLSPATMVLPYREEHVEGLKRPPQLQRNTVFI